VLQTNDDRWPMWNHRFGGDDDDETNESSSKQRKPDKKSNRQSEVGKLEEKKASKDIGTGFESNDISRGQFMKLSSIGTELFAAVLVGTFLGWIINRLFGNKIPWVIAIGVIIGAIAGLLNLYNLIVEEEKKDKQRKERRREG
jgi:F0F1-type ATP synthase assembly protein I